MCIDEARKQNALQVLHLATSIGCWYQRFNGSGAIYNHHRVLFQKPAAVRNMVCTELLPLHAG